MLSVADAFDAATVTTLLSVREMIRAHRRVSRECHTLFRRYQKRLGETSQRADAENNLLDVIADATATTSGVLQVAVAALTDAGAIATPGEREATRRFTSGAVEDTLRWTAVHPTASASALRQARDESESDTLQGSEPITR